jgi:hemerythrin superfamily protein
MADDVVTLIIRDHRALEKLFEQVNSGNGDRRELLDEILTMLTAHSRAEEERVYPRIAAAAPAEKEEVEHGTDEHHKADELLREAILHATEPDFQARFTEFVEAVQHHVEEEESDILPTLEDAVDAEELERLGREFAERRQQELDEIAGRPESSTESSAESGSGSGGGSAGGSGGDEPTLRELQEEARRLDIEGRSTMNKDELAKAIDKQR